MHPNIVRIYDFNESDGMPYLSMELIEGPKPRPESCAEGPMDFREAAEMVRSSRLPSGTPTQQKVVHRDLKPLNVLFTNDGTPEGHRLRAGEGTGQRARSTDAHRRGDGYAELHGPGAGGREDGGSRHVAPTSTRWGRSSTSR